MPSQGEHRSGWRFVGVGRRLGLTTSALLSWELCLSMLPASVTCPFLCLFPLAPCSSAWLSLCPSVSPSSLPHLLQPLCGLLLSLTILYLWLSQTPAHSSLDLSHPCLLLASFLPSLSVCPVASSLSLHLPVLPSLPALSVPITFFVSLSFPGRQW